MKKIFILSCLFIILTFTSGCTAPDKSIRILTEQGYTDIQLNGYQWFACSEDDTFSTGFTAKKIETGATVRGVVCSDFFKGSTVRTY